MNFRINLDAAGIVTSIACAIHCAILPLAITSLPVFGINIVENAAFEYFMIGVAIVIGFFALWHGYRKHHHRLLPIWLFAGGAMALIAKQIWHHNQYWLLGVAVLLIVSAHWINYRASKAGPKCNCRPGSPERIVCPR
ncbi:MAG: MerC domain-containing protein [Chitinophagaceae bacterium]|nr:MAG: MerC domain-containing protein [Chitinophagaceae bacterium]